MISWEDGIKEIILYHGGTDIIHSEDIDIDITCSDTDFGKGFYLTTSSKQARRWAKSRSIRRKSPAILNIYGIRDMDKLSIKEFKDPDIEWIDYVLYNRVEGFYKDMKMNYKKYDIIIGPVADDNLLEALALFMTNVYGDAKSLESKKRLINSLETHNLVNQYCFRTYRSLKYLRYIGSEKI